MTPEMIEGTATVVRDEQDEPRGLAVVSEVRGHLVSGLGAVMALSDEDFDRNLVMLARAKDRAQKLQRALLTEGTDYGTVPGIPRPFLHKPGAEIFEKAYGLATSYEVERKVGDGVKTPELEYIVHAKVHLGDTDGPVVGEGLGSCNTHETKYRYRAAKRRCPSCGNEGLIKGKLDGKLKGAYWCPQDKGGCNNRFNVGSDEYKAIEEQVTGQVENENPYDLANTILKMARKRAGVDAILTTTGTSGLFTQDDDSPAVQRDARPARSGGSRSAPEESDTGLTSRDGSRQSPLAPKLPKIPQGITEETELGEVTLEGTIEVTDKSATDGSLRQGKDGAHLGFRMVVPGGANVGQVILRGQMAEALATIVDGDAKRLHGLPVTVTGQMIARPWSNSDGDAMPPARRTEVTRIQSDDWTLPAPPEVAATEPKSKSKPQPAAKAAGDDAPGMTAEGFKKALKAGRVAGAYAEQVAKSRFDRTAIADLTDQQRLELAAELELIGPEEE